MKLTNRVHEHARLLNIDIKPRDQRMAAWLNIVILGAVYLN